MEANFYPYSTKNNEMRLPLAVRGIEILNFAYNFSILERSHGLSDTNDGSFLLPIHVLEAEFHLPLNRFFCNLFQDYEMTPS